MTFEKKYFIKNLFLVCLIFLLILLLVFFTYSLRERNFSRRVLTDILMIDEDAYGNTTLDSNNLKMSPILDKNYNTSNKVMHISFNVGGSKENNQNNFIYDIALADLEVSCELLSPNLKWKLIKNGNTEFNGSLDYKFDTIKDGRLVLTDIQQDLVPYNDDKSVYDHYDFYLWISDSCQEEDILQCRNKENQENLMNKILKGKIEVELYGEEKKELVRTPSEELDSNTCLTN